ncbi:MAG: hypothetical protein QOH06_2968 [Acidobacteriota bacterium]|jgi:hypothetical protein|nr:hypothetical protein [Acidobacteriota bacterium]
MPRKRLLPLFVCLAAAAVAQRPETFEDKLFVREVELVFEAPDLTLLHPFPPDEDDLLVIEDGLARPVIKAGSVDDPTTRTALRKEGFDVAPWNAVVWVDEALAQPETVFVATLALAQQASSLTELGSVEVVVAGPEPEIEVASTRETRRLEQVLADLAGKARVERDRASSRPWEHSGVSSRSDTSTLRRQLDRLLVHLAGKRDPGPRLLFLVADGFAVTPHESRVFETGTADPAAGERAAVIHDAARLLAAYGWVTVALPLRKEGPGEEHRGSSDVDRFRANTGPSSHSSSVPPVMAPGRPKDSNLNWEGALRALIQPDLSPLRALVDTTAGTLVAQDALLPSALEKLGERWHLYYQTQMPMDGQLRPVEVRLRNGTALRSRRWVRSSTPEGLADARLRLLLSGEHLPESLPLTVEPAPAGLKLTVAPFSSPDPVTPGPVRISLACAGTVQHQIAPGIDAPDKGWSHILATTCPPEALLVEDLARERWRAVRLDYSK